MNAIENWESHAWAQESTSGCGVDIGRVGVINTSISPDFLTHGSSPSPVNRRKSGASHSQRAIPRGLCGQKALAVLEVARVGPQSVSVGPPCHQVKCGVGRRGMFRVRAEVLMSRVPRLPSPRMATVTIAAGLVHAARASESGRAGSQDGRLLGIRTTAPR